MIVVPARYHYLRYYLFMYLLIYNFFDFFLSISNFFQTIGPGARSEVRGQRGTYQPLLFKKHIAEMFLLLLHLHYLLSSSSSSSSHPHELHVNLRAGGLLGVGAGLWGRGCGGQFHAAQQ